MVKINKIPYAGEREDLKFQKFAFDDNLGKNPLTHKVVMGTPAPWGDMVRSSEKSVREHIKKRLKNLTSKRED